MWRRRSYGSDDVHFDYSYLAHPATVTGAQWRRPEAGNHHEKHVLYTICADLKVRVWAATEPHALQRMQLWTEIDMQASIQPRIETATPALDRYMFLVDSTDFSQTVSNTVLNCGSNSPKRNFIEHLLELDMAKPDICVILDSKGHLSAWALDQIGAKAKARQDAHNIAHLEDFNPLSSKPNLDECHGVQILAFAFDECLSQMCLLIHQHDGSIVWWEGEITEFFDPSQNVARLRRRASWQGHDRLIEKVVSSPSKDSFISWSGSEAIIWNCSNDGDNNGLVMQSRFRSKERIIDACLLDTLGAVITLHDESLSLWTIRQEIGRIVKHQTLGKVLHQRSIFNIQASKLDALNDLLLFAVFTPPATFTIWRVSASNIWHDVTNSESLGILSLQKHSNVKLDWDNQLANDSDLAPSIQNYVADKSLVASVQQNDIIFCLPTGDARVYQLESNRDGFYTTSTSLTFNTGVNRPYLMALSSTKKLALIDESGFDLTIWDVPTGTVEYNVRYTSKVTNFHWLTTSVGLSALAFSLEHKIVVLAEVRLNPSDAEHTPWTEVREIEMKDQTSQAVKDFTWIGSQTIVVASGIQLLAIESTIPFGQAFSNGPSVMVPDQGSVDLSAALKAFNGSLPIYHPQYVLQIALTGRAGTARKVLKALYSYLKFFSDGEAIPSDLGLPIEQFYSSSCVSPPVIELSLNYANGIRCTTGLRSTHKWQH